MKNLFLTLVFIPCLLFSQIKVTILDNSFTNKSEFDAALSFVKKNKNLNISKITLSDFTNQKNFKNISLLWIHRLDSSDFNYLEKDEKFIASLKKYLSNGGKLFLSMDAVKYLNFLNLETDTIKSKYVDAYDEGYGRKLGLHSFINHPIFDGLNGGAYIFNPIFDVKTRQVGFFEQQQKLNGKVVAVDWSYITMNENSKLVLEYDYEKGKILTCGAYVIFNLKNQNEKHFQKFIENCFIYLVKNNCKKEKYFWNVLNPIKQNIIQCNSKIRLNNSNQWEIKNKNTLIRDTATLNYWNVAGESILVMGKENYGIDEIWAHPFMAIKNYQIGLVNNDSIDWLKNYSPKYEVHPNCIIRTYITKEFELKEVITTSVKKAVAVIHYEIKNNLTRKVVVSFQSNMRLMWPYSENVLGNIHFEWNKNLNGFRIQDERNMFSTIFGINKTVESYEIEKVDDYTKSASIFFETNNNSIFDVVISASSESTGKSVDNYINTIKNTYNLYLESKKHYDEQLKEYVSINTPNQDFNEGYIWAIIGTKKFMVNTPSIGKSLVAGYSTTARGWNGGHKINGRPGYAWYFGRDGVWSGFALLDVCDYISVKSILEMFNKFQDLNGKIFHELTTSGAVHYDASDSTPLYLILSGRYLKESGDINFIKLNFNHIKKALEFCFSTDTDKDHLIENTNVGHGWVEGGGLYTAHTEVYLAACWAEALKWSSYIYEKLELNKEAKKYYDEYLIVKNIINTKYWNEENKTLSFSKLKDGSFNNEKTVLSAVPIYFGMIDTLKSKSILYDFAENYFSSDWGVRILRSDSKIYNPRGYHTGSVWPLFTGWTALAEYKYHNDVQAFSHIMNNLLIYKNWQLGGIEEVLNGDEYKPAGVCPQQCWSQTMVIQPVIEGLLGLQINALNNELSLEPQIPIDWNFFEVKNIKVRNKKINLFFKRENGLKKFFFSSNSNEVTIIKLKIENQSKEFRLEKNITITFKDISNPKVISRYILPQINDNSKTLRILDENFSHNIYEILVQGKPNTIDTLSVYSQKRQIEKIENGRLINNNNTIYKVAVNFDPENKKYINKKVKIYFRE